MHKEEFLYPNSYLFTNYRNEEETEKIKIN